MKPLKLLKSYVILFALTFFCLSLFAQASGTPVQPDVFSIVLGLIQIKYQAITFTVLAMLYVLEQILASSSKIQANSTFQLIGGWLTGLYNAITNKKSNS